MEANNVQSQLVSEEMKREARELIGRLESIKISAPHMKEVPHCVICMIRFVLENMSAELLVIKTIFFAWFSK